MADESVKCRNCGGPLHYSVDDAVYLHEHVVGGYWCDAVELSSRRGYLDAHGRVIDHARYADPDLA